MAPTQGVNISIDSLKYTHCIKNGIENNKFMVLIIFTINQCKIFLIQILISVIMLILFDPFKVMLLINPCCDSNRPFLLWHKERNPATERVK